MRYSIGLREANHHLAKHIKRSRTATRSSSPAAARPVARLTHEIGAGKVRDAEWRAAYERMLQLMANAPRTEGELRWTRDEIYDR